MLMGHSIRLAVIDVYRLITNLLVDSMVMIARAVSEDLSTVCSHWLRLYHLG